MKDVMIDIETLGTTPGSTILSIGAVWFGPEGLGLSIYGVLDRRDSLDHGFTVDRETVVWWEQQAPEVSDLLRTAYDPSKTVSVEWALGLLGSFVHGAERLWSRGSDFDLVLLAAAYRKLRLRVPWSYRQAMCFRTLRLVSADPGIVMPESDRAHNALDDAKHQARQAVAILNARGWPTSQAEAAGESA